MLAAIAKCVAIGVVAPLTAALALIATQRPAGPILPDPGAGLDFSQALAAKPGLDIGAWNRDALTYRARDGAALSWRWRESARPTDLTLLFLHGSGWHGMQFEALAGWLAAEGLANAAIPDLRGHGGVPAPRASGATPPPRDAVALNRRGDVAYIGQLEDDIADLVSTIRARKPDARIIVAGHSSGGGLAVRFAGGAHGGLAAGYLLLAPFLKYNAPTTRPDAGGWARPLTRRIIGLSMLNAVGVTALNHLTVIEFALPKALRDGPLGRTATDAYSFRMNASYAPRGDYGADLAAIAAPLLVVAGADDEAFFADEFQPVISAHADRGRYALLAGVGHLDLPDAPGLKPLLRDWLADLR